MMATYGVRVNDGRGGGFSPAWSPKTRTAPTWPRCSRSIRRSPAKRRPQPCAPPRAVSTRTGRSRWLIEVRRFVDGQAGMAAGDRRRMLVVADRTGLLGAAHRPDATIFGAFLARSGKGWAIVEDAAESLLRAAGVYTEYDPRGWQDTLLVFVTAYSPGPPFDVTVSFRKSPVYDDHGNTFDSVTWRRDVDDMPHLNVFASDDMEALHEMLDRFMTGYLDVNRPACSVR